jgi:hypothetical protein
MTIFKVTGRRNSGLKVNHHVGADSVHLAILSVLNADKKICRIDRVVISEHNET